MMKKVCVVIPVHLPEPSIEEELSFKQCISILSKHDIFLIAPHGLDVSVYTGIYSDLKVKYVNRNWLANVKAYNKMKIDIAFYKIFSSYQFMLTFELDSFVFRDELLDWCEQGHDFIGAPWFSGFHKSEQDSEITGVGNSGFSLRNIQSCLDVLRNIESLVALTRVLEFTALRYSLRWLVALRKPFPFLRLTKLQMMRAYLRHECVHEDIFWSFYVPVVFKDFRIAPVGDALKFSFDASPRQCFILNDRNLPFGCHAWTKFDLDFWEPFIYHGNVTNTIS